MTSGSVDVEFATFTQHFLNRTQRRRLGIELGQDDAGVIYGDDAALRREFATWQTRTRQPLRPRLIRIGRAPRGPWHRWMTGRKGQAGRMTDGARQIIHFHRQHYDAIVSGEKVTTVRWGESVRVGASTFVFDEHPTAPPLAGHVTAVRRCRLDELSAEQARQPAGTDMALFAEQLRENWYPEMPDDAVVEVAELTVATPMR